MWCMLLVFAVPFACSLPLVRNARIYWYCIYLLDCGRNTPSPLPDLHTSNVTCACFASRYFNQWRLIGSLISRYITIRNEPRAPLDYRSDCQGHDEGYMYLYKQ